MLHYDDIRTSKMILSQGQSAWYFFFLDCLLFIGIRVHFKKMGGGGTYFIDKGVDECVSQMGWIACLCTMWFRGKSPSRCFHVHLFEVRTLNGISD